MSRKKNKETKFTDRIPLVFKTGKAVCGYKRSLKTIMSGDSKMIILTKNFPQEKRKLLEHLANLQERKVPIYNFEGSNNDLSSILKHNFRIGVISVINEGKSDLLTVYNSKMNKI